MTHMSILMQLLEALLLVTALSMDAFVSGFAYGTNKIRIPTASVLTINLVCSFLLAVSLLFGRVVGGLLPGHLPRYICFAILLGLGIFKIFDSAVKSLIRRHDGFRKKITFTAFHVGFILSVYADPENADQDHSRILSPAEAAYLAAALSLDGLAVGFGAGVTVSSPWLVIGLSLVADMLAVVLGCRLGNRLAKKTSLNLAWLSGALLIVLAVLKIL